MENSRGNQAGRICPRGAGYYVWQAGDTLEGVALRNRTTAQAIAVINPDTNFAALPAGTEICIPNQVYTCITGEEYAVQPGDTLNAIAARLGITVEELRERNPGVDTYNLQIGQILCVPSAGAVEDGTGMDDNTVQPPVGDGTGMDDGVVTPGFSCPVGFAASTVQVGQTYADLLIDHNVSYRAMRTTNPALRPGGLIAGTRYCAPLAGTRQLCGTNTSYTIQPGETLASLAQKLNTTPGRLLMLNPTLLPTDFSSGTVICT
ncbi:MAG: LysM peptidoglycan-binding domain-containing protein [Clostridia bacterium]|nr:LysM peptidoglycan-binding domain-containing protein [Clostridia bacterium]